MKTLMFHTIRTRTGKARRFLACLVFLVGLSGCKALWSLSLHYGASEEGLKTLRVALVQTPFHRLQDTGLERELVEHFARDHQYQLQIKKFSTSNQALEALKNGPFDLAIGVFDPTKANEYSAVEGPVYNKSHSVLVCPKARKQENSTSIWSLIFGTEQKIPDSVQSVVVDRMQADRIKQAYPGLQLTLMKSGKPYDELALVANQQQSCAILEQSQARFFLRLFPTLHIVQDVNPQLKMGFLIHENQTELLENLQTWFSRFQDSRDFENLKDLYFSHFEELSSFAQTEFLQDIQEKLPTLLPLFKKVATEFSLPWQLVAAVAYQESKWDSNAESFTGVRGLMMLTQETAECLGVVDRTDILQSLWGGTKYLRYLMNKQPHFLSSRERLVMTLASYNVGPAHVADSQTLAAQMGRNPYSWRDLKKVLPLLSYPEYFEQLEHGEARGQEPVTFTNRVLSYYEILGSIY